MFASIRKYEVTRGSAEDHVTDAAWLLAVVVAIPQNRGSQWITRPGRCPW